MLFSHLWRRKNSIFSLDHDGVLLKSKDDLRDHVYGVYKAFFSFEKDHDVGMANEIWSCNLRVVENDNMFLLQDFTKEEVWKIIKDFLVNFGSWSRWFP